MSSWTDEDEDGDTHASSPTLVLFVGRRRRCSQGWCQAWTPSSHFPGLGHNMNPIPYPPLMNFPPSPYSGPHSSGGFPCSILYPSSANCHPLNTSPICYMGCCSTGTGYHREHPCAHCPTYSEALWHHLRFPWCWQQGHLTLHHPYPLGLHRVP